MAVALVLAARPAGDPELLIFEGQTSKGWPVVLRFVDGELRSATVEAAVRCPGPGTWHNIPWSPRIGAYGEFRQDGDDFRVEYRYQQRPAPEAEPVQGAFALRGEVDDDGESARGTIAARWISPGFRCAGTVRFRAG